MSKEFIAKEVDKIIADKSYKKPQNVAMACAWILGNLKAVNLKVLNVSKQSSLADYFVIGSATNPVQSNAMADEIVMQMKRLKYNPVSQEGADKTDWILIDLGNIIVHVFSEGSRDFYKLDELWVNATHIDIPQSYYFSSDEGGEDGEDSGRDYF